MYLKTKVKIAKHFFSVLNFFFFLWLNIALSWTRYLNKLRKGNVRKEKLSIGLTFCKGGLHLFDCWICCLLWLHGKIFFFQLRYNWLVFVKETKKRVAVHFNLVRVLPPRISKSKSDFMTSSMSYKLHYLLLLRVLLVFKRLW